MTKDDVVKKIRDEIHKKGIKAIESYTPSSDHYIPLRHLEYYLGLAYGIGFDEGRIQHSHGKKVVQLKDGIIIKVWDSKSAAARAMQIHRDCITNSIKGITKNYKGFEWKEYFT